MMMPLIDVILLSMLVGLVTSVFYYRDTRKQVKQSGNTESPVKTFMDEWTINTIICGLLFMAIFILNAVVTVLLG